MIKRNDYYTDEDWNRFLKHSNNAPTPHIVINLDIINKNYQELVENFPNAGIYYAIKANPAVEILKELIALGSSFDIASIYELDRVLSLGVSVDKISYGNTIKKASDIAYAFERGVDIFATDSLQDLENIAKYAPGSRIYVRILVEGGNTADWPLSKKFGCHTDKAVFLLRKSVELKLKPYGISFHVGSQQNDIEQWNQAIIKTKHLFDTIAKEGIKLKMVNMGGGLPAKYYNQISELSVYAEAINRYIANAFGEDNKPEIIFEPGRSLVANAGVLVSEIILVARKGDADPYRWVYIDAGKFNGLIETLDESIRYPIVMENEDTTIDYEPVIMAGPTCDSFDVLYIQNKYQLPVNIKQGDRLYWLTTGAYTSSYASVEFNGFPPIKTIFFDNEQGVR
jgi:ornithine decarboxylase